MANINIKLILIWIFCKAPGGLEAVNVVGKNGYLILDIIAFKREIPPIDLEIINGFELFLFEKN